MIQFFVAAKAPFIKVAEADGRLEPVAGRDLSSRPNTTSRLAHLVPKLQLGNRHRVCRRRRVHWFPSRSLGTRNVIVGQRLIRESSRTPLSARSDRRPERGL